MASNEINDLLDGLVETWETANLTDLAFTNDFIPRLIADPNDPELDETQQKLGQDLKNLMTPGDWVNLAQLVRKRPKFQQKRRLQNLNPTLYPLIKDRSKILTRDEQDELEKLASDAKSKILATLENSFLDSDRDFASFPKNKHFSRQDYETLKSNYVHDWVNRELNLDLSSEQVKIVSQISNHLKVTARAGSGKTRVLVIRAIFLIRHCRVPKESVILLAFNKKAADEMRLRLAQFLGVELPHVMTFHALAYGLVNPLEGFLFDDPINESPKLSLEIQKLINSKISEPNLSNRVRDVMLKYFRDTQDFFKKEFNKYEKSDELKLRRSLRFETLNGEFVKSHGEKIIANILFENNIEYAYEKSFVWEDRPYRPDFTISCSADSGIVIEYFGLRGQIDYDELSDEKRKFWAKKPNWKLIEKGPNDIRESGPKFEKLLIQELRKLGLSTTKLTDDELWLRLKPRAINRFTASVKTFIQRCRKLSLSSEDLAARIDVHEFKSVHEEDFVKISQEIYGPYLSLLKPGSLEDFDGLLNRAIDTLNNGLTHFGKKSRHEGDVSKIRHVLVDEFQDFSMLFYRMLLGIKKNSPLAQFLCVGDDWQAINGFAGSDLTYFENFERDDLFLNGENQHIPTNFRSAKRIVDVGNALMTNRGNEAIAYKSDTGTVQIAYIDRFIPNKFETYIHHNDEITPLALRILNKLLATHENVTILSRTNKIPYLINHSNSNNQPTDNLKGFQTHLFKHLKVQGNDRVSISTTHDYKGLESDAIIIIDANNDRYPLIHPTWEFFRLFGDTLNEICEEERRLLYVALTRAVKTVIFIADHSKLSPFIDDENVREYIEDLDTNEFPKFPTSTDEKLEIAVFNSYAVKDKLKSDRFIWDKKRLCWFKIISNSRFSIENLKSEAWNNGSVHIEVKNSSGELVYRFKPSAGK